MSDSWQAAKQSEDVEFKSGYISSKTVDEGEGLRFVVEKFEVIPDTFNEGRKVGEIKGTILESRAHRFEDGAEITIGCRSVGLERLANQAPEPGDVMTLLHDGFVGKPVNWKFSIDRSGAEA
jgi:hypothetical protein